MSTHTHTQKCKLKKTNYIPKMELTNKPSAKSSQLPTLFDFTFAFFQEDLDLSVFTFKL